MKPPCSVEDCTTAARSSRPGAMCEKHYYRMRRNGTLTLRQPRRPQRGICIIDGCTKTDTGYSGLCNKHGTRQRRHGDPHKVIALAERRFLSGPVHPSWKPGEELTYSGVHMRVRAQRGPATIYPCVDCSQPAQHWSYMHGSPQEMVDPDGRSFTPDIHAYEPRCVSCHKYYDKGISA